MRLRIHQLDLSAVLFFFIVFNNFAFAANRCEFSLPNVTQLNQDIAYLSADFTEGRKFGSDGHKRAVEYIERAFKHSKLQPVFNQYFQTFVFEKGFAEYEGGNVVGRVNGSLNNHNYVIVTAHLDHLGRNSAGVFNGADDNASGVAAMLSIVERFCATRPNKNYIFVATDAEELGLKGARAFLASSSVNVADIEMVINLDMLARKGKLNTLFVAGTRTLPKYSASFNGLFKKLKSKSITVRKGHDGLRSKDPREKDVQWQKASDHWPFAQQGIPYLYFGGGLHSDYHKTTDTYAKIDNEFFYNAVVTVHEFLTIVDEDKP